MCTLYGFLVVFGQSLKCTPGYTLKKLKNKPRYCQQTIYTVIYAAAHGFVTILLTDQLDSFCASMYNKSDSSL